MTVGPPTYPTVTPGDVVFDATEFQSQFPAFAKTSATVLSNNFNLACLQLQNSAASVVQDAPTRQYLLYLITAHITELLNGSNGNPPSGVVGRVASASQGSVSVSAEWAAKVSTSSAYYLQTQYGATYWQSTAPYRTGRYVSAPRGMGWDDSSDWNAWPQ